MVTKKNSPVHGMWLKMCNKEREKQKLRAVKVVPQYNIGLVLNKQNISREQWYEAAKKYKTDHKDVGWLKLCQKCGLHKSHSNAVKKQIVNTVMKYFGKFAAAIVSPVSPVCTNNDAHDNVYRSHIRPAVQHRINATLQDMQKRKRIRVMDTDTKAIIVEAFNGGSHAQMVVTPRLCVNLLNTYIIVSCHVLFKYCVCDTL